jgi:hypothetical protein
MTGTWFNLKGGFGIEVAAMRGTGDGGGTRVAARDQF